MFSAGIMTPKSAGGRKGRTQRDRKRNEEREITEHTRGNNAGTIAGQQRLRVIYLIFPYSAVVWNTWELLPFSLSFAGIHGKSDCSMMRRCENRT